MTVPKMQPEIRIPLNQRNVVAGFVGLAAIIILLFSSSEDNKVSQLNSLPPDRNEVTNIKKAELLANGTHIIANLDVQQIYPESILQHLGFLHVICEGYGLTANIRVPPDYLKRSYTTFPQIVFESPIAGDFEMTLTRSSNVLATTKGHVNINHDTNSTISCSDTECNFTNVCYKDGVLNLFTPFEFTSKNGVMGSYLRLNSIKDHRIQDYHPRISSKGIMKEPIYGFITSPYKDEAEYLSNVFFPLDEYSMNSFVLLNETVNREVQSISGYVMGNFCSRQFIVKRIQPLERQYIYGKYLKMTTYSAVDGKMGVALINGTEIIEKKAIELSEMLGSNFSEVVNVHGKSIQEIIRSLSETSILVSYGIDNLDLYLWESPETIVELVDPEKCPPISNNRTQVILTDPPKLYTTKDDCNSGSSMSFDVRKIYDIMK